MAGCSSLAISVYTCKKRRFHSVSRCDPSTFTLYWLLPVYSTSSPDLSHLLEWRSRWFCRNTRSLVANGRSRREWGHKLSVVQEILVCRASSFVVHVLHQSGRTCGFENFCKRLTNESETCWGCPEMISAGKRLQSRLGVLRSCRIAWRKRSWSRLPVGPVLDIKSLLAALTATLALPLDKGEAADDTQCCTFQDRRKFSGIDTVNYGPPSLQSSSSTLKVVKNLCK